MSLTIQLPASGDAGQVAGAANDVTAGEGHGRFERVPAGIADGAQALARAER
ncbi:MAG: hypothetical protein V5A13_05755 [Haloarculaceae archaeon]